MISNKPGKRENYISKFTSDCNELSFSVALKNSVLVSTLNTTQMTQILQKDSPQKMYNKLKGLGTFIFLNLKHNFIPVIINILF